MAQKLKYVKIDGLDQKVQCLEVEGEFGNFNVFAEPLPVRREDDSLHMLVKFTEPKFALNLADSLSLATPEYYRTMNSWDGRIDDQEAVIETKHPHWIMINDRPFWCLSSSVSYNAGWLFCVSNLRNDAAGDQLRQHFFERGLWSLTSLRSDIKRFAFQLGADFGRFGLANRNIYKKQSGDFTDDKSVLVVYGSVLYMEDRAEFLKAYPEEYRSILGHFVKRKEFAVQREYRFLIAGWGKPQCPQILLPISMELRELFGVTSNNVIPGGTLLPMGQKASRSD